MTKTKSKRERASNETKGILIEGEGHTQREKKKSNRGRRKEIKKSTANLWEERVDRIKKERNPPCEEDEEQEREMEKERERMWR